MARDTRRPEYEQRGDAAEEFAFHLEMLEQRLRDQGMTAERAAREARRQFGDRRSLLSECRTLDRRLERREKRSAVVSDLFADLRLSLRGLRTAPVFALTAVLTLTLAIGATTALFSVVRGVLLQPLPYEHADRIVLLSSANVERGLANMPLPQGVYRELGPRAHEVPALEGVDTPVLPRTLAKQSFELAVYQSQQVTLLSALEPRRLDSASISENLLRLLGVEPALGRAFLREDVAGLAENPCLISHRVWRSDFAGSSTVLGQLLGLEDGAPSCTVIGILPADFGFPDEETDLWQVYRPDPSQDPWRSWSIKGLLQVREGVQPEVMQQELDAFVTAWDDDLGFGAEWQLVMVPLHQAVVGDVAPALWVLLGAVGLLLLIACINLGGLLLARTSERGAELAVRAVLGASRARLARQLFAESLLLCGLGGLAGTGLAHLLIGLLRKRPPVEIPRLDQIQIEGSVLIFAVAVTLLSTVVAWIAPLTQTLRNDLAETGRTRGFSAGPARTRLRSALVVVQAALAMSLLTGALLLGRSFLALTSVDLGFDTSNLSELFLELPSSRYPDASARSRFFETALREVSALAPVVKAGLTTGLPLKGVSMVRKLEIEGDAKPPEDRAQVAMDVISPEYFEVLNVPMLEGRGFDSRDQEGSDAVAIINQEVVRTQFGGRSPLGKRLILDRPHTIVGVVGSIKQYGLRDAAPLEVFVPFAQNPRARAHLVVRSDQSPDLLTPQIREIVTRLDPALVAAAPTPLDRRLSDSVERDRFNALAMGGFGLLATVLVSLGLYGVVSFVVERRRREFGVRMALGASRVAVFRSVVRRGVLLGVVGVGLGLAVALVLSRSLEGLLFGIAPNDPLALGGSAVLILVITLLACGIPASRATRVDSANVLRSE